MLHSSFSNKPSFIKDLHETLRSKINADTWEKFEHIKPTQRVEFILSSTDIIGKVNECIEVQIENGKSDYSKDKEKAMELKNEGNEAFGKGGNEKALFCYSKAVCYMPQEDVRDLSIVYANRSATLYHLQHYEYAQSDIDTAFKLGYPIELHYKLYERSGRCFLSVGKKSEAARKFNQALNSLVKIEMEGVKLEKLKFNLQNLLKSATTGGFGFLCGNDKNSTQSIISLPPIISSGPSRTLRNASAKLTVKQDESRGRFVVAKEEIKPGEVIVVEKAYVGVLMQKVYHQQCFECFDLITASVPCLTCSAVSYCSIICRDKADKSHHKYECGIIGILEHAGVSITCLMALRILTKTDFSSVIRWYDILMDLEASSPTKESESSSRDNSSCFINQVYKPDHISSVLRLVSHANIRTVEDLFQRIVMGVFLVGLIKRTGYLGDDREDDESTADPSTCQSHESPTSFAKLVTLLVKLLQLLQFNAHEIAGWDDKSAQSYFIGGGLFPTLALFNHSCNPSIVRYFMNDTVIVRTVRTIHRGEEVTENYGPVFTSMNKADRMSHLEKRYWFTCTCIACREDWPLFEDLSKDNLSFSCSNCHSFLCKTTTDSFGLLFRCGKCLKPTNILKSLKTLEKSEGKYKQAIEFLGNGRLDVAAGILIENLELFDSILLPPFKDYLRVQEALRKCYLPRGNKCIKDGGG